MKRTLGRSCAFKRTKHKEQYCGELCECECHKKIEWERKLLDLVDNKESGYVDFAELIRETISNREQEIAEAFRLYGQPSCANLNHPKKYRHDWSGNCPAEKKILLILKHYQ